MYNHFIDSLTKEEREAMAWYIAHIILADGKIVPPEKEFMTQILKKIHLDDSTTAMNILNKVKNKQKLDSLPNLAESDHTTVMKIFMVLLHVAVSDFELNEQEEVVLLIIGSTLGFSEQTIEGLIEHHKGILKICVEDALSRNPCTFVKKQ